MPDAIDEILRKATTVAELDAPCQLLVVDDEPVIRQIISAVFEEGPYEFSEASTGEEGLQRISDVSPRVVLVDKNLPDISGLDIIRLGKELAPDTEFLMITGFASMETAIQAMQLGAFGYITKPFADIDALRSQVDAAADKNRAVILNRVLTDRLKEAYEDLFKTKVEIEMLADVTRERLRLRYGELQTVLDDVLKPLVAVDNDLTALGEFVDDVAEGVDVRGKVPAESGRLKMLAALLDTVRIRANALTESLASDDT